MMCVFCVCSWFVVVLILKLCFCVNVWICVCVFFLINGLFFNVWDVVDVDIFVSLVNFVSVNLFFVFNGMNI